MEELDVYAQIDVGYIGFSMRMLTELIHSPFFCLKVCICETKRATDSLKDLCKDHDVEYYGVNGKQEMMDCILSFRGKYDFIMYENGIILEKAAIPDMHIYNFHPGSLLHNRGANPIIWSILKGNFLTEMTVHEIDAEIDRGIKIDARFVEIAPDDDSCSLRKKLDGTIPELLVSLYAFIKKSLYMEKNFNVYNRRINEMDYTICLDTDTPEQIVKKVQSQKCYRGAIFPLDGAKVYIRDVEMGERTSRVLCKKGDRYCVEFKQVIDLIV